MRGKRWKPSILLACCRSTSTVVRTWRRAFLAPARTSRSYGELELWTAPVAAVERILTSAEALPPTTSELVLVHGDLHLRHVLVEGGSISGVIDWGDVCRADPCIDLMLVWSLLTPAGRLRFLAEYGQVTAEQHLRSRVLALVLDSMLVRYAHDSGHPSLQREAIAGLERTLID